MLVWALPSPGVAGGSGDRATATLIRADEWKRFAERFVRRDGRVVDPENGGVTHSEAQGYGMILAVYAGERSAFDRIWGFTRRELQVREGDALLAWQWDPRATPRVRDMNNATDGDVLVAYALLRAAARWSDVGYARAADRIVDAIGSDLIARVSGRIVLRPGAFGFDHIPGNRGPVVNPSYFIFAAFPLFEVVRPDYPWRQLTRDAIDLLDAARMGRRGLVPDWVALSGRSVSVAEGFAQRSSYDAVRVPLYLLHGGRDPETTAAFDAAWNLNGDGPVDYHLGQDRVVAPMADPGYRAVAALVACARRGTPLPRRLRGFRPTTYFASSLHLIALATLRRDYPGCLLDRARTTPTHVASRHSSRPSSSSRPRRAAQRDPQPSRVAYARPRSSFSDSIMRKSWLPSR